MFFTARSSTTITSDHDHIKVLNKARGQLLDEVRAAVLNVLVDLRHAFSLPFPVVQAFLLSGELLLLAAKPLIFVFKPTRISYLLSGGEGHEAFDAEVYAHKPKVAILVAILSVDSRVSLDLFGANKADMVLTCGY